MSQSTDVARLRPVRRPIQTAGIITSRSHWRYRKPPTRPTAPYYLFLNARRQENPR